jgi:hypothetical protein
VEKREDGEDGLIGHTIELGTPSDEVEQARPMP